MNSVATNCKDYMCWKPFLALHTLAFVLFGSWIFAPTASLWAKFDTWIFQTLNSSLVQSPLSQIFWALANVKMADLVGAIFMVTFTLIYVFDKGKDEARLRLGQFFYILIWFEIGISSLKELLFRLLSAMQFLRDSPSLVFSDTFLLSEVVPWLKVKDSSHWCFPSDHAFIVLQWAGFITFFCGWRLGLVAYLSSSIFIFSRLIAGAHWASDAFVGSLAVALVFLAWACHTPIYPFLMKYLQKLSGLLVDGKFIFRKQKMGPLHVQNN